MPRYVIEVVGRTGCGCEASVPFELNEDAEPTPGDVAVYLALALDPEQTDLLEFLSDHRHGNAGYEKVTVTAQVKVR